MFRPVVVTLGMLLLSACNREGPPVSPTASPPPPEVTVLEVKPQVVPLTREVVGRLAATRTAQVRARVPGIVLRRVYPEGSDVKAGSTLFQIDPAQLEATLHTQQAALAKAEADASNAAATARRYSELYGKHLLSRQDLDTALASQQTTAAAVKGAKANLEVATLNLSYATVTAPIGGRAGEALVREGALVGQGETTHLTTIEQIDPIYVGFSVSERELEDLRRGAGGAAQPASGKVEVQLPDGSSYPQAGTLDFSNLAVDPNTGAVAMRAVLPNPQRQLLPGMFVKLRLTLGQASNAFVVSQAAVSRDAKGAYVLVVDPLGKVEQRRVETLTMTLRDWVIGSGLREGDRVIVSGLQKVRPGGVAKAIGPKDSTPATTPATKS